MDSEVAVAAIVALAVSSMTIAIGYFKMHMKFRKDVQGNIELEEDATDKEQIFDEKK